MILSAIAAMASNRVIGKEGGLPWNIPEDMKFFKDKTMGRIMIMGRKTFESFGRPLPGRLHVIVTRQKDYAPQGAHVFPSLDEALAFCREQTAKWGDEIFVVGGGEIYAELLNRTDKIYLTEIHQAVDGDTRFPEFSLDDFVETERIRRSEPVAFDFVTYERRKRT